MVVAFTFSAYILISQMVWPSQISQVVEKLQQVVSKTTKVWNSLHAAVYKKVL